MQPIKKCKKKSGSVLRALFPYLFIYLFIYSFIHLFNLILSFDTKIRILGKQFFSLRLAFTFSSIVPNDFLFMCLLACLFAKMRHLLRLRNGPDKEREGKGTPVKEKENNYIFFILRLLTGAICERKFSICFKPLV